jgi:hypothetical protein
MIPVYGQWGARPTSYPRTILNGHASSEFIGEQTLTASLKKRDEPLPLAFRNFHFPAIVLTLGSYVRIASD